MILRTIIKFRDKHINIQDASTGQIESGETLKSIIFDKWKNVINKKNGNHYTLLTDEVVNATNKDDGAKMSLYIRNGVLYVRENVEFDSKFEV